tara:strand:+ start:324 stop:560 length:237 start_codon:yes stop_codon:yes gene_type:complete
MTVSMHVSGMDSPSKTRRGTVYSNSGITNHDIQAAKTLIKLSKGDLYRKYNVEPLQVNTEVQHHYNTRYSSRMNTPRY